MGMLSDHAIEICMVTTLNIALCLRRVGHKQSEGDIANEGEGDLF